MIDTITTAAEEALARAKAFKRTYIPNDDWTYCLDRPWSPTTGKARLDEARAAYLFSADPAQLATLFAVAYLFHFETGNALLGAEARTDVALIAAHAEVLVARDHQATSPGHGH